MLLRPAAEDEINDLAQLIVGDKAQASMGHVQAVYPPDCLHIAEIHVAPQHRGDGIGDRLLGSVVERAGAEGVRLLGLQTLTSNPARPLRMVGRAPGRNRHECFGDCAGQGSVATAATGGVDAGRHS